MTANPMLTLSESREPRADAVIRQGLAGYNTDRFRPSDNTSEPDYELSMRLFENGIGADFLFEYGEFSIRARLDRLEALPRPHC